MQRARERIKAQSSSTSNIEADRLRKVEERLAGLESAYRYLQADLSECKSANSDKKSGSNNNSSSSKNNNSNKQRD
jgi:hypothetical protein